MRVTVIGCSGSMPGPDSPASCYLVEHDGVRIVLDMGNGSAGALQPHAALETIDAIVLSHLHADHCLDACAFVVWQRYSARSQGRVPLYGPSGTAQRLSAAYEQPPSDLGDVFDFHTVTPDLAVLVGSLRLSFARTNHPVETYAVRVEHGSTSLTYSGDSGVCDELVDLARGSDLLICEAARPDGEPGYPDGLHLTGAQAGEHAVAAEVERLILTHVPPWVDARVQLASAQAVFAASELAAPGAVYTL